MVSYIFTLQQNLKEHKEIPIYQLEDLFKELGHDYKGKTSVTHDQDKNIVFGVVGISSQCMR